MKTIIISDVTLASDFGGETSPFTFREKIEVAKLLDRLCIPSIELGTLSDSTEDILLIKSVASAVLHDKGCFDRAGKLLSQNFHDSFKQCAFAVAPCAMQNVKLLLARHPQQGGSQRLLHI